MSGVTCYVLHVTYQVLHVRCQVSNVTCHNSLTPTGMDPLFANFPTMHSWLVCKTLKKEEEKKKKKIIVHP